MPLMRYAVLRIWFKHAQKAAMEAPALRSEMHVYNRLRQEVVGRYGDLDDETIRDTLEGRLVFPRPNAPLELELGPIRLAIAVRSLRLALRLKSFSSLGDRPASNPADKGDL